MYTFFLPSFLCWCCRAIFEVDFYLKLLEGQGAPLPAWEAAPPARQAQQGKLPPRVKNRRLAAMNRLLVGLVVAAAAAARGAVVVE